MALTEEEKKAYLDEGMTDDEIASLEEALADEESGDYGMAAEPYDPENPEMQPQIRNDYDPAEEDDKEGKASNNDEGANPDLNAESNDDDDSNDSNDSNDNNDNNDSEDSGDDGDDNQSAATIKPVQTPLLNVELPEDWQEQKDSLESEREALAEKFDDGDLETKDYNKQLREIDSKINKLDSLRNNYELAAQMEENRQRQAWIDTATSFLNEPENQIFQLSNNKTLYNALNTEVISIASSDDGQGLDGRAILEKARDNVMKDLGMVKAVTDSKVKDSGKKPDSEQAPKKPNAAQVPKKPETVPTLNGMPASAVSPADEGNPYRRLDEMNPIDREEALASMSEAEYNRYMEYSG